jgi:recombination protein RecT
MPPATVARIVLNCLMADDKLQQCTQVSVLRAVVTALALGLEPNNVLGEAHLVPHSKECVLYIGYRGLVKLAFNTGMIGKVEAFNAYSNERFKVDYGADQEIHHEPLPPSTRGDFIASWCKVPMTTGHTSYTLMWHEEIESIRKASPMGSKGPWAHPHQVGEMRKKTVIKRACKLLPRSPIDPLQRAVALDNQADAGQSQDLDMIDVEPMEAGDAPPPKKTLADFTEPKKGNGKTAQKPVASPTPA